MRKIYVLYCIWFFSFASCTTFYDADYYEKSSGISIPGSSRVIESHDNGEWCTITSFLLNKEEMKKFILTYKFEWVQDFIPTVFGSWMLKKEFPDTDVINRLYHLNVSRNELHSSYLIDTAKRILWASISYPDWGGQ